MYGYVTWGRRPALTAENIGGVWFAAAALPETGPLAAYRRRLVWRALCRRGVSRCVMPEALEAALHGKRQSFWGLLPVEVSPLRLAMLHQLLDTCGDLRRGTAVLRAECATPTVYRAAVVLAGRVRYLSLELDNGGEALEQALRQRFGLCLGRVGQPAVTVSFGGAPSENTICLGEDCRHYQRVTYDVPEGMPGPWPVSEPLLAVLFEAGAIKKEQIRVKTIAFNA